MPTESMIEMLAPWVPYRAMVIYTTGVLEWILAISLLIPKVWLIAGWACIACLILFLPANLYAAFSSVGTGGQVWGSIYLFIRISLQLILIGWAYWFVVRKREALA